ncbi:hypothetical protein C0J52_16057 [Blattella germanica]|nr:hypothetical protein C0J52_16057 [Blattella germanica]
MRLRLDTEVESPIVWEKLPYTRRHSQRSAARNCQIGQWTMKQLMISVFRIFEEMYTKISNKSI